MRILGIRTEKLQAELVKADIRTDEFLVRKDLIDDWPLACALG